jgi:hypothetical protein
MFEGDLKIWDNIRAKAAEEGSEFSIRPLAPDPQGGWRCTQNITMRQ